MNLFCTSASTRALSLLLMEERSTSSMNLDLKKADIYSGIRGKTTTLSLSCTTSTTRLLLRKKSRPGEC